MHRKDRHSHIDDIDVQSGNEHGNSAAAARVNLSEFARLPLNSGVIEKSADNPHEFSRGIAGARLSSGPGIFGDHNAVVAIGGVVFLMHLAIGGIKGGVDIRRKAGGGRKDRAPRQMMRRGKILNQLTDGEIDKLRASAEKLKEVIRQVEI